MSHLLRPFRIALTLACLCPFFAPFSPEGWAQTACSCASPPVTFGTGNGSAPGQLAGISAAAEGTYNGTEYFYLADIGNNRIDQFNAATGNFTASFDGVGPNNPYSGLANPYAVGLSPDGRYLFAGATNGGCVVKMDLANSGLPVTAFSVFHPIDVNVGPDGAVYVCSDYTVNKYVEQAPNQYVVQAVLGSAGVSGSGPSLFGGTFGTLPLGNYLFIADPRNSRIVRWNSPDGVHYSYDTTVYSSNTSVEPCQMAREAGTTRVYVGTNNNGYMVFDYSTTPWTLLYQCFPGGDNYTQGIALDGSSVFMADNWSNIGFRFPKPTASCFAPVTLGNSIYLGSDPPADSGKCFIYPSPVRGDTATLTYDMAEPGTMDLKVWSWKTQLAAHVTDHRSAGLQITPLQFSGLAPSVYYYEVTLSYDSGRVQKIGPQKFVLTR